MKVYIGPYKSWLGPYQIADLLQNIGFSEDRCEKIGDYLDKTWLRNFCEWIDNKKKRNVKIKIDNYDVWGMDHTLSLIILPMLKKLQEMKHGAPNVDDEDVPDGLGLRSTEARPKDYEWEADQNHFKRWDWVLEEMIWTFEQVASDDDDAKFYDHSECNYSDSKIIFSTENMSKLKVDREGLEKHHKRIENGLRLFGKYYQSLWD
jgi:hypothetical protein